MVCDGRGGGLLEPGKHLANRMSPVEEVLLVVKAHQQLEERVDMALIQLPNGVHAGRFE